MHPSASIADHVGKLAKDGLATLHRFYGGDVILNYLVALGEFTNLTVSVQRLAKMRLDPSLLCNQISFLRSFAVYRAHDQRSQFRFL